MRKINVLDKSVAEKIAAGEVVERPASVIKELVENSIDALATSITIEIEKGGTSYMRVTDNGSGIEKEDVAVAFVRHATSKIKDEKDLESIATLGFRGEALCSISAVSRVEMMTKTQNAEMGTYMLVEGGETKECRDAGCPLGTTVTVRNIFFNTPARGKFLKKDATEAAYITDICQRAALSHPEVSIRYIRDGKDIFFTPGDNVLKNTVRAVFGKDISENMLEVSEERGIYRIEGLTGSNKLSRPNRSMQYFFVNGRLVKSALLSQAIGEAYKNELMVGKFPVCVLDIKMPCDMVDVNVHPAKTEVKFAFDEEVYRAVALSIRDAVAQGAIYREGFKQSKNAFRTAGDAKGVQEALRLGEIRLAGDVRSVVPPVRDSVKKENVQSPVGSKSSFTPVKVQKKVSTPFELPEKKIETLRVSEDYDGEKKCGENKPDVKIDEKDGVNAKVPSAETMPPKAVEIPPFIVIGQLFETYIVAQSDNEMLLVDQHAAHERINYERIKNQGSMKQTMLMPLTINLTAREMAAWEENRDFLDDMGFESDDFGHDGIIVRTLPSDVDYDDGEDLIIELIDSFMGLGRGELSAMRDKAVYTVACKAAIKANKILSGIEMEALLKDVFLMEGISTCPHGRPIIVRMTKYQIEKMFKRIV